LLAALRRPDRARSKNSARDAVDVGCKHVRDLFQIAGILLEIPQAATALICQEHFAIRAVRSKNNASLHNQQQLVISVSADSA
jgi:hypothetical protein